MTDLEKTNDLLDEHEAPKTKGQETFDEKTFNDKNEDDAKNYVNSLMEKGRNEDVAEHIDIVAKKLKLSAIPIIDKLIDNDSSIIKIKLAKKAKEIEDSDIVTRIVEKISEKGDSSSISEVAKNLQEDSFINKLSIDTVNKVMEKVTKKGNQGCVTELAKGFKNEILIRRVNGVTFGDFLDKSLKLKIDVHESGMDSNKKAIMSKLDTLIDEENDNTTKQKLIKIKSDFQTAIKDSDPDEYLKSNWPELNDDNTEDRSNSIQTNGESQPNHSLNKL